MLSWSRPAPNTDFASEASWRLAEVRQAIESDPTTPLSKRFRSGDLWSGSWKGDGRHKKTLIGPNLQAKCAWCERLRDDGGEIDVEHYRPKSEVTRWQGEPPLVSDRPPAQYPIGDGYWWLAFTWDNYSLACKKCNSVWKRNLFPMHEPRPDCVEGIEVGEKPLLLNPASPFRTADHFRWTIGAIMEAVSEIGRATIVTCGLNRRELVAERLKVARIVQQVLPQSVAAIRRGDVTAWRLQRGRLCNLGDRSEPFTGMVRWFTEDSLRCRWEEIDGMPP